MDKYRITGPTLRDFYPETKILSEIFADIEKDVQSEKKVVCRFIVNDYELDEEAEKKFAEMSLSEIQTIEFWTDQVTHLIPDIVKNWKVALPELMTRCDEVATEIRYKGMDGHYLSIHRMVENCEFLVLSLVSMRQMIGEELIAEFMDWNAAQEQMQHLVKEAYEALEKKDFVLLADVLEFDLGHNLGQWLNFLNFVEKNLQKVTETQIAKDLESENIAVRTNNTSQEFPYLLRKSQKLN